MLTLEEYKVNKSRNDNIPKPPSSISHPKGQEKTTANLNIDPNRAKPYSPKELWDNRCGMCSNCLKPDCLRCATCVKKSAKDSCCLQKMCEKIPLKNRVQHALSFPQGWYYIFGPPSYDESDRDMKGLVLFAPNGRKYRSAEKACNHNPKGLSSVDPKVFYSHVGLPLPGFSAATAKKGAPYFGTQSKITVPPPPMVDQKLLTPQELWKNRCGNCPNCLKPECLKCASCVSNMRKAAAGNGDGSRECCLQAMCCNIETRLQPAWGFPPGWVYEFKAEPERDFPEMKGLVLTAPNGRGTRYKSVEKARNHNHLVLKDLDPAIFYRHVGLDFGKKRQRSFSDFDVSVSHAKMPRTMDLVEFDPQSLIGRGFSQKWISVDGTCKILFGTIVHYSDSRHMFKVKWNSASRAQANSRPNRCGLQVPETQEFFDVEALGGCDLYQTITSQPGSAPPGFRKIWLVPEVPPTKDFTGMSAEGQRLPKLTLIFRGFKLCFRVKKSLIPNAGFGVFASCQCIAGSDAPYFELPAGELLDLGVYAPHRAEDLKTETVLAVKNFLFSLKPEGWIFDTDENNAEHKGHCYDITDDFTGELHDGAKMQVPVYVNETDGIAVPTVTAAHDPEVCAQCIGLVVVSFGAVSPHTTDLVVYVLLGSLALPIRPCERRIWTL